MAGCIVAFPREEDVKTIRSVLVRNGFPVTGTALSGASALNLSEYTGGGIMICAYQFRDMVYTQLRRELGAGWGMILVCNPSRLPEGVEEGVIHLPVPLRTGELLRAVRETEEALRRRRLSRRGKPGERTPQQKQDIAAAKARIMEQKNITEAEAHRYLQQLSMETGRTLPETAQMILRFGKL